MRINHILLKNFKCFRETDIRVSRITLLTGENSSGKSSVLYGLLTPFQSKFPFYLSPNGKYVTMGDFREMSFNNLKENKIGIDFSVIPEKDEEEENFRTLWKIDAAGRMPELDYLKYRTSSKYLEAVSDGDCYRVSSLFGEGPAVNAKEKYKKLYGFLYSLDIKISGEMSRSLNFIGPFRPEPERTYYQKTKADEKIGKSGEGYIDQILEWENHKAEEIKTLRAILKNLGLFDTMKVSQLPGGRFELNVRVRPKGVWASLADVGFGISQFLPVITADLQLPDHSALLLAQPEIHLHPSVQAALGDYFVRQVRETDKQYIVETHSEYLLNRIRLAIVKREIDPSDVSVYYFENSVKGSKTYPVEFTTDGQIRNAPKGFFDTYMMDTMDIALHA
ncbi:DUF3696 domain-containing protein [Desulfobacterales bacterium HSG2]|nr:DUF3696 domain-containing protein [Desulfobacterales bacterium HSG2]